MSLTALAGLVLALALLIGLHLRLSKLPVALWAVARKERALDGGHLLDAMKEAVATRSGQAVIAVQTYHEHLAQSLRIQIAEAETRARMAERRAADTVTALQAAASLLRELRTALEATSEVTRELRAIQKRPPPTQPPSAPPPAPPPEADETERKTTEMPPSLIPPGSGRQTRADSSPRIQGDEASFDDEDEMTRVADRPGALAAFRLTRRAPTLLPPAPARTAVASPRTSGSEGSR